MNTGEAIHSMCEGYEKWGASPSFLAESKTRGFVSVSALEQFLTSIETSLEKSNHRLLPFVSGNGSTLRAFPCAPTRRWNSCEQTLIASDTKAAMCMLPFFWQIEPLLFAAARGAGAPLFMTQPDNFAVAARAIDTAGTNTIITTPSTAQAFAQDLTGHDDTHPRTWLLIRLLGETVHDMSTFASAARVTSEIHLVPGVPLLVQCEHLLMAKMDKRFHVSEEFELSLEDGRLLATVRDTELMPLFRLELPFPLKEVSTCQCGKSTMTL